eukprot:2027133-Prorocentrum_lima.AAC.1
MAMVVEVCVLEAGDSVGDWRLKLHIPLVTETVVEEQFKSFKDRWDVVRPDVPVEWSGKYQNKGGIMYGVYAEIHKVEYQYMIPASKT